MQTQGKKTNKQERHRRHQNRGDSQWMGSGQKWFPTGFKAPGSRGSQLINRLMYCSYMMSCCRTKLGKHKKTHRGARVQSLEIRTSWLESFSLEPLLGFLGIFFFFP